MLAAQLFEVRDQDRDRGAAAKWVGARGVLATRRGHAARLEGWRLVVFTGGRSGTEVAAEHGLSACFSALLVVAAFGRNTVGLVLGT